jgi:hypothetical protein
MKHIVGFSGGVDSQACARWVLNRYPKEDDILNWSLRRPEMIDKIRRFETRTGYTFFVPVRRDGVLNRIDEVLAWARTERGGKKELPPIMFERQACESKYGLCA